MNIINLSIKKFNDNIDNKKLNYKLVLSQYKKLSNDNILMHFNINGRADPFSFNGLKIIYCDNPNLLIRNLLNEKNKYSNIFKGDENIKTTNIFHFNPFTKISDVFTLKSTGMIHECLKRKNIEKINNLIEESIIMNYENIEDGNIKNLTNINLKNASILNFLEFNDSYLSKENIKDVFNIIKNSSIDRPLIIINDYEIISVDEIINNYVDHFDFLIITNNFKNWINQIEFLELVLIMKDIIYEKWNEGSIEITSSKILLDYLEEFYNNKKKKSELKMWLLERNM